VWVENVGGGPADLEFVGLETSGRTISSDKVFFYPFTSIVIALGGESQVPTDPADGNHGIFRLAIELYNQGYDVHMYDEDAVDCYGAGAAYDEVNAAVQGRNVGQVAIYGYSHGGGSTCLLAERLDNHRSEIGSFTIPFTAYIDGVSDRYATGWDGRQEHMRPPGSLYHLNYYQVGVRNPFSQFFDDGLDGGPVNPIDPGWEQNMDDPVQRFTHRTIDDDPDILAAIRDRLFAWVAR
jgi:hypothetical protein